MALASSSADSSSRPSTASMDTCLYLPDNALRFEPVSASVDVFYDEFNQQVFAVHERGSGGVEVLSPVAAHQLPLFRIADKGPIISIKFSHDIRILAIQRNAKSVEFCNYIYDRHIIDTFEYSQTCRSRSSKIIGFAWTGARQLVLVTDSKWELYEVQPNKHALRANKSFNMQISWFLYYPPYFLVASGPQCMHLDIFYTRQQSGVAPYLFNKIDLDLSASYSSTPSAATEREVVSPSNLPAPSILLERDVALTTLYSNQLYLLVIRQPTRERAGAEILLYHIPNSPQEPYVSHVLSLGVVGRFAINVLDNVLAVHHQQSKTSALFDIFIKAVSEATNVDKMHVAGKCFSTPQILQPLFAPRSIRPRTVQVLLPSAPQSASSAEVTSLAAMRNQSKERNEALASPAQSRTVACTLYASTWAVFYPNVIVDAKLGCFWELQIDYAALTNDTSSKPSMVASFLSNRTALEAKHMLLAMPRRVLLPLSNNDTAEVQQHDPSCIQYASCIFNALFREISRLNSQGQLTTIVSTDDSKSGKVIPSIPSMTSSSKPPGNPELKPITVQQILDGLLIFAKTCRKQTTTPYFIAAVTEIFRSALKSHIDVPYALYEMLVNTLLETGSYGHLQYLMQYRIIADSKRMACLLLANSRLHKPVLQTSLDMLTRLEAHEEVIEILLSQGKILTAVRYIEQRNVQNVDTRKFLQSAYESGDKDLFYTVYKYFERSVSSDAGGRRSSSSRMLSCQDFSQCESMTKAFNNLFLANKSTSNPALK